MEKDMCTFFIFGLSAIRPRDALRPRLVWTYPKNACCQYIGCIRDFCREDVAI